MKILVLNCGSSSLKYQLINMENKEVIAKGNYEKIGTRTSFLTHKANGQKYTIEKEVENHEKAIDIILQYLINEQHGVIKSLNEITAIGHRIVQGGEYFNKSVIITEDVIEKIRECAKLAPLHNLSAIKGIEACKKEMPGKLMVATFDTAFHQTIQKERFTYAVPYKYYEKYKVRKYGAHGTSYKYVSNRISQILKKDLNNIKMVICHLGQGASLCAIEDGKSVDTTMGLSPLGGIMMCQRSGDIDPSVITFLMERENISPKEMEQILNLESGVLGIAKVSSDFRDILKAVKEGNQEAELGIKMYEYNVAQYIAKMMVATNGAEVIAFTGGIGENQIATRKGICRYLEFLGVEIDDEKNNIQSEEQEISTENSKIKVFVIPTNEELLIAMDTMDLYNKNKK